MAFIIFAISLVFLVLGADWFLRGAEKMGLALGLSPFIVGVTIVAFGTSFPELFTAISAVLAGATEMVVANAVGSNIANILLVVGASAVVGGKLVVTKNLIDVDLPLLMIGTVILIGVVFPWMGEDPILVTRPESIILVLTYVAYLFYGIFHKEEEKEKIDKKLPTRKERRKHIVETIDLEKRPKILLIDWFYLIVGGVALTFSAKYLVESVISISEILNIGVGVISILAVALGTSLPELVVSIKAAFNHKPEVALGNVFGSNVFNSFIVIGIPGLLTDIKLDEPTFAIGLPIMFLATLLFVISGISRRIHNWEGIFYLSLYVIFTGKILGLF